MSLRVIGGKAKGKRLKPVPGLVARPIMDRVKESLFNILGESVPGSRWLDLFAGTGSVGIEALSRGAAFCFFVDLNRDAVKTIHYNLNITHLETCAEVQRTNGLSLLSRTRKIDVPFDAIYVAPPQYLEIWRKALVTLDEHIGWLTRDGIVVVQIDPREFEPVELRNLTIYDERRYGNTLLLFYSVRPIR